MTHIVKVFAVAGVVLLAACGSSNPDPTGPTPGGSGSCRELASDYTAQATSGPFSATTISTCAFNATTRQVSCTHRYTDSLGSSTTTNGIAQYNSVADLVDEVAVIPPRTYVVSASAVQTGSASGTSSAAHTFDGSRRLVSASNVSAAGTGTTTYTAWDASGRPTAGNDVGTGYSNALTITYDNTARTRTTSYNGGLVTTIEAFDANGNPVNHVSAGGASVSTTTFTTRATQRVCK